MLDWSEAGDVVDKFADKLEVGENCIEERAGFFIFLDGDEFFERGVIIQAAGILVFESSDKAAVSDSANFGRGAGGLEGERFIVSFSVVVSRRTGTDRHDDIDN